MGSICLIHNLLSGGAKARAIAPEPLNIYLGMQVCYQGQTASTLPSQQSHLPPWGGGGGRSDSEEKEDRKRKRGGCKDTATFFVCFYLLALLLTVAEGRVEGGGGDSRSTAQLFSSSFFSCARPQGSWETLTGSLFFFRHLLKIHVSVSSLLHNSSITIPTWRQRPI